MHSYLKKILAEKKRVVDVLLQDVSMQAQLAPILNGECQVMHSKQFMQSLARPGMQVIAEVKRKSPSKGLLAAIQDPLVLATEYAQSGAAAISVLTDEFGFSGSILDLKAVAATVSAAVLRKDFILHPIQIAEAIYYGAKAVLLIVAVLGEQTKRFVELCALMGIDALVEVHNKDELAIALAAKASIIGINNRNLQTFSVDIDNALRLREFLPEEVVCVAESGIKDVATARLYRDAGFDAVLIGEALVTANSPAAFIKEIMNA